MTPDAVQYLKDIPNGLFDQGESHEKNLGRIRSGADRRTSFCCRPRIDRRVGSSGKPEGTQCVISICSVNSQTGPSYLAGAICM
jgi:hypothetical protein